MDFPKAEAISRIQEPLSWTPEKNHLMVEACREMAIFHEGNCREVTFLYKKYGFDPETIEVEEDLARIPVIGVAAMKRYLLTSLPHEEVALKLTSSGTRGQKTQIWFDGQSLKRVQTMLKTLWEQVGFICEEPTNYLMFVYDPKEAKDLGIAFSDKNQQQFAPVAESFYTIKKNGQGNWEFQTEETLITLQEFGHDSKPVRIFGIPSFIYELLQEMESRNLAFRLPSGSLMVTGGGWKAAEEKRVSRDFFRNKVTELLGIPVERVRDGYGMAEHSAPYIDCPKHRFHVPAYNRILARDPITMDVLPVGETGLLELITPFNAMMPNLAILSTDLGFIDPETCDCGYNSPTFSLVGRGGLTKHIGCAIHASDIVQRNGVRP